MTDEDLILIRDLAREVKDRRYCPHYFREPLDLAQVDDALEDLLALVDEQQKQIEQLDNELAFEHELNDTLMQNAKRDGQPVGARA